LDERRAGISAEESTGTARDLGAPPTRRMGTPPFSATAGACAALLRDSRVMDLRRRNGATPPGDGHVNAEATRGRIGANGRVPPIRITLDAPEIMEPKALPVG